MTYTRAGTGTDLQVCTRVPITHRYQFTRFHGILNMSTVRISLYLIIIKAVCICANGGGGGGEREGGGVLGHMCSF